MPLSTQCARIAPTWKVTMSYKSDIEIAREAKKRPIQEIGAKLGISSDDLLPYGHDKAKVSQSFIDSVQDRPNGKLILVTAINPTPAGEGKTTTTVGLGDGLNRIGKKAAICIREASLGPNFGMKGGAAGGGYAQVVPMEDINLHFTGDFNAIALANNLLAAGTGPWRGILELIGVWRDDWMVPGCSPVAYLDRLGVIDRLTLVVHGVQFDDAALARLAEIGATLVTCPRSNQWVGVGAPPIERSMWRRKAATLAKSSNAANAVCTPCAISRRRITTRVTRPLASASSAANTRPSSTISSAVSVKSEILQIQSI